MKSIKQLLLISLKKLTILTLVFSIAFIHCIEFKIDVQATSITSNPFEALDLSRNARIDQIQNNKPSTNSSTYRTSNIEKLDNNQYFVKFKDTVTLDVISRVLTPYVYNMLGSSKHRTFAISTNDYLGLESALSGLVEYIEKESDIKIAADANDQYQYLQWGLNATKIPNVWNYSTSSNDVYVCIIDTGLTRSHNDLRSSNFRGGIDYSNYGQVFDDPDGHGTFVAGIIGADTNNYYGIAGIAYNSYIIPFKIPLIGEYFDTSKIIEAVYDAADGGCDVINMSLGGPGYSATFNSAIQYAYNKGSIIIAAAGNEADEGNPISYPASYNNVISVGSIDENLNHSYFSNYNNYVDVVAPGEDILSTDITGSYSYGSGTSFSAPHVSGIAALLKSVKPDLTTNKFLDLIKTTSQDLGTYGYDNYYGYGLINVQQMFNSLFKPNTIQGVSVKLDTRSDLNFVWVNDSKANNYEIQVGIKGNTTYSTYYEVNASPAIRQYANGNTYETYKVRGVHVFPNGSKMYGDYSTTLELLTPPSPPNLIDVSTNNTTKIIQWQMMDGATGYDVYRNGALYKSLPKEVTSLQVGDMDSGVYYYYSIRVRNGLLQSRESNFVTLSTFLSAPLNFKIDSTHYDGFTFSWTKKDSTEDLSYEVLMSTDMNTGYKVVATTKESSVSVKGLTYDKTYYFKLRAVDTEDNIRGLLTDQLTGKTALNSLSGFNVTSPNATTVDLSWNGVEGSAGYEISYSKGSSTTYTILRSVTTLTTNHTGLTANTTYNYRVRAYRMSGTTKIFTGYSEVKSVTTPPVSPVLKVISKNINTLTLNWSAVPGATSYELYQDDVLIQTLGSEILTLDVSSLDLGISYKFKLVALNGELRSAPSVEVTGVPIPSSVSNFKISDVNFNRLSLSWDSVEGADHYDIYQGTSSTAVTTKVGSVTETSFSTTTPLNFNTVYYYKVIPVTLNGVAGSVSAVINGKTAIKNPVDLSVSSPNATTADLSWSAVEGAAGYEISYSKGSSTTYTILRSVTTMTTNHTGLTANTSYNYKIRAYRMAGTVKVYSGYSEVKSVTTPPVSPVLKVISKNINTLTLNWSAVPGATSYELYQDDVLIQTLGSEILTLDVSSLDLGISYKFKLVALNGELRSAPSVEVTGVPIPSSVSNFKISDVNFNRLSLSWDSVEGADHYDIYQGTSSTAVNTKVGSATETSFSTTTPLNFNTVYYYKVIPVTSNGVSGSVSAVINGKTAIKNPVDLSVSSPNATTADLSWSAVEGAAGYEISYSKGSSTTYTILRSVTTLTTNHTGLTLNTVFNYRIRAYRMAGTTKVYSGYSEVKSITTPPTAPVIKAVSKSIDTITVTWTKVVGATGYVLYVNGVETIVISDGNTITTDVSGLNLGESYDFSLVAKNGELTSASSTIVKAIPIPSSVSNFKISDVNFNRISLTWDSVEGADHYDVYQGTSSTAVNTKVGSVTETSFSTTTPLNFNTVYYYKVIPVTSNGVSGSVSAVINGKTAIKNPVDLSVSSLNATTADLSWSAVEGAAGYEISYSKGTSTTYTILRSVTTLTTNHTGLTLNTVFNYRIRAYRMAGTTKVYSGYSEVKSITTPPTAPVIKAVSKSIDTITVTWTKVVGATGYVLYVNGVETIVISDGNTITTDVSGLNLGESYNFSLVAKNGELTSASSTIVKAIPIPSSVSNFKISDVNFNRLSLTWDSVEGADHYDVYQGTSSTAVNTKVGSATETSFSTTTPLNFNTVYYYKVIPVTSNGVSGSVSAVINGKTAIKNPVDLSVSSPNATTADLSWSAVEGAAGYEISYSKGTSTTYTILRSVTTLTTNHTGLTLNTVFNYRIRAYRMAGTTKVYSGYSEVKSITTPPTAPVIKAVSKSIDTITVTWTKVVGATGYVLYVNGVETIVISDGNTITTDVSGLNLGESYDFSLVAKNGELTSASSTIVKAIPIPSSVSNFKISDVNFNRISLSWDSVEGADHYDIYQGTSSTAVNTKVGSVTETSFSTTTPLNFNTVYYYKVIPVTSNGVSGTVSTIINAKTSIKSPTNLTVGFVTRTSANLNWTSVEGATGYEVYYAKDTSSTYTLLRTVNTNSMTHSNIVQFVNNKYKVRAYRMVGTTKYYSAYSEIKEYKFVELHGIYFKDGIGLILELNESANLGVYYMPLNATNVDFTYTSSDSTIVSVDENGNVTAHSYGKATITVTNIEGVSGDIEVTVQ